MFFASVQCDVLKILSLEALSREMDEVLCMYARLGVRGQVRLRLGLLFYHGSIARSDMKIVRYFTPSFSLRAHSQHYPTYLRAH